MSEKKQTLNLTCEVDPYRGGWTVLDFLTHRFRYHPAERWRARLADGRVRVNGAVVSPDHVVRERDVVGYTIHHAEPEVDFRYDVIYEDEEILAVSKSGNLPVHASGVFIRHTLIRILRERFGDAVRLAHRLDRETSGVVLLARTRPAARALSRMFAEGRVEKRYTAVVHGRVAPPATPPAAGLRWTRVPGPAPGVPGRAEARAAEPALSFEIDAPIGKAPDLVEIDPRRESMCGLESDLKADLPRYVPRRCVDFAGGKPALTRFEVERYGEDLTVLIAAPHTGRTNQIRVHLAHIEHPLVGDKVYGDLERDGAFTHVRRQALHCRSIEFIHPTTGRAVRIEAPVPNDMRSWMTG